MNPKDALKILNQASGMAPLNRATHFQVQQAIDVLDAFIDGREIEVKPTTTDDLIDKAPES